MTLKAALVVMSANALVCVTLITSYALWIAPSRAPRLALLDVAELYRLKEREIAAILLQSDATEETRTQALKRASGFGVEITALIEQLPRECRCVILARGAIIGSAEILPDMTPAVRQRLGL